MAARRTRETGPRSLSFGDKLVLNQWMMSLLGVDPLAEEHLVNGRRVARPWHVLAAPIRDARMEGLDADNIHLFYKNLIGGRLLPLAPGMEADLLRYEQNIVQHTQRINEKRIRSVVWKYFQWLDLLFTEIYLDRYFSDLDGMLRDLNAFVDVFNVRWNEFKAMPHYEAADLNKLCFQNATGSGKTLLMHVNLLQFQHYSRQAGRGDELSRVILLTPNERLSQQHLGEFAASGITAEGYVGGGETLFTRRVKGLQRVDVFEITKLQEQVGPTTIATRSLGDQNLLLVDEGHRGMSGKEEGKWLERRNMLCARGFTFEYSATFKQAVATAKNPDFENAYAKCILFDYSYQHFYGDGFGKDYQILNLPATYQENRRIYMAACLLKFYQQLRCYEEGVGAFADFNIEKPLWVFVGASVVKATGSDDEKAVAADVVQVLQYLADFLADREQAVTVIGQLLSGTGRDTGLLDEKGNDIFAGAFNYLSVRMRLNGETPETLYGDIMSRLFQNEAGGRLTLARIKGDSGEVALKCGQAEEPFGLVNVGDAVGLCKHCQEVFVQDGTQADVVESDFSQAMFASVRDSGSSINLLVGSKKFIEGWDCWRVSTMGLMHVGKSEGTQIIQLFGRGVRLKGWQWTLKRSGHTFAPHRPANIEELETLNVFGIEADFMAKFREFLKEEGLPGNERRHTVTIPFNVTYDFGKKLQVLRPKRKKADGKEYDFKKDGPVPSLGYDIPEYLQHNTVVADWYPRIESVASRRGVAVGTPQMGRLRAEHLALLDYDALYFEVERFKRERAWHNLNVTKDGIRRLLEDASWYTLYIPPTRLECTSYENVNIWMQVAGELLREYTKCYYNYRKAAFLEPRLEYRELRSDDDLMPQEGEVYQLITDGSDNALLTHIEQMRDEMAAKKKDLIQVGDLCGLTFNRHLYQPLFHVRKGGRITVLPVALNESEYEFVKDLKAYLDVNKKAFAAGKQELFLLRNKTRGGGIGFFEAQNFYPDFILWILQGKKQFISFIEPHGLLHEGPAAPKIALHKKIKEIEARLDDPAVVLNSFILSWTQHPQLKWGKSRAELEKEHVLFMTDDKDGYVGKLLGTAAGANCDG